MRTIVAERRRMMETAVQSMGPAEQIELVFDHALLHLEAARDMSGEAAWEDVRPHLSECQKAVSVLLESLLNPEAPGADPAAVAMAANLRGLYLFVINALIKADMSRTQPPYQGLLQVLGDLADGWKKGVLGRA
jgi:flagellin-specific chaperone FliS